MLCPPLNHTLRINIIYPLSLSTPPVFFFSASVLALFVLLFSLSRVFSSLLPSSMATEVHNGSSDHAATAVTFSALKPQLFVQAPKAVDAVRFYKAAFGAVEVSCDVNPKRKADQELPHIVCAQLKIGSVSFLVSDADDSSATKLDGGARCVFCLETEDVEAAVSNAVAAGGVKEGDAAEGGGGGCCGARGSRVKDPYGFVWLICSPPSSADAKKNGDVEA